MRSAGYYEDGYENRKEDEEDSEVYGEDVCPHDDDLEGEKGFSFLFESGDLLDRKGMGLVIWWTVLDLSIFARWVYDYWIFDDGNELIVLHSCR